MTRLPRVSGDQAVAALIHSGFERIRQRGSHVYMRHPDGRRTVVPVHAGETLGAGLLAKILRDAGLARDEFERLL